MARFKFRLQAVLSYKEQVEEALKAELARLREAYERELSALRELEGELVLTAEEFRREEGAERLDLAAIELLLGYLEVVEKAITAQSTVVEELGAKLSAKREEVLQAVQERKTLEKLRDRLAWRAALEARRREDKLIDEVASARFTRERSAV